MVMNSFYLMLSSLGKHLVLKLASCGSCVLLFSMFQCNVEAGVIQLCCCFAFFRAK